VIHIGTEGAALSTELGSLFVIMLIAVKAPLLVALFRLKVAEVVILLGLGILVGPEVLGIVQIDASISLLAQLGLGFLFFFAGLELEPEAIKGRYGKLAAIGWGATLLAAGIATWVLEAMGHIENFIGFAIVLTSTALGTLLPVLRDSGELKTPFGKFFMGAGAIGEFGPILTISLLLSSMSSLEAVISLISMGVAAYLLAKVPQWLKFERLRKLIGAGEDSSAQTPIRITLLFLVGLLAIAATLGLDVVLGAFIAGVIFRLNTPHEGETEIHAKVEGIGFGFLIPIFFIVSGVNIDILSIIEDPAPMFIVTLLLLIVRGLPQFFIYRNAIPVTRDRIRFSLYVATALPIIVAVTTIQVQAGVMTEADSATLVGAGALSVLLFPLAAYLVGRNGGRKADPELVELI
jgi:Kef-type K+ transport system membrane component KefB